MSRRHRPVALRSPSPGSALRRSRRPGAARISAGSVTASAAIDAPSCAASRAPTTAAATPGRSRTQASATASGGRAQPFGGGQHGLHDPGGALRAALLDVRRDRGRVGEGAGQHPAAERRPRQQPGPVVCRGGEQLGLGVAGEQGVLGLHGGRDRRRATARRPARPPRRAASPPARRARRSGPARTSPPRRRRRASRRAGRRDPSRGAATGRGGRCPGGATAGPARPAGPRAPRRRRAGRRPSRLRPAITRSSRDTARRIEAREDVLRDSAAVAVGRLHQRPARLHEHAQLLRRGIAVGVVAPGHRAQADPRHLQPAAAHPSSLHVGQPKRVLSLGSRRARRAPQHPLRRYPDGGSVGAVTFSGHDSANAADASPPTGTYSA